MFYPPSLIPWSTSSTQTTTSTLSTLETESTASNTFWPEAIENSAVEFHYKSYLFFSNSYKLHFNRRVVENIYNIFFNSSLFFVEMFLDKLYKSLIFKVIAGIFSYSNFYQEACYAK